MHPQIRYLFSPTLEFKDLDLSDFPSVVNAFEQRMKCWFLNPIEQILQDDNNLFVATAIECIFIESLSSFLYGGPFGSSKENVFRDFIHEELGVPEKTAEEFYLRFCSGILSEANIRGKSAMTDQIEHFFLAEDGRFLFSPSFFKLLQSYFNEYMKRLRSEPELQMNFRKRFISLFWKNFSEEKWVDWMKPISDYDDDVRDSILKILQTTRGEIENHPDFGCEIHDLVFETINTETLSLIETKVREALILHEPRIEVVKVSVLDEESQVGKLLVVVDYRVRLTKKTFQLVYPFYMVEGY